MSQLWTLDKIRELAGLPVSESTQSKIIVESDEDEDPDVKIAMADKRQHEFESKNKRELDTAKKTAADKAKALAADKPIVKKVEPKSEQKVVTPPAASATEEKKKLGKAPNANSKAQRGVAYLKDNPDTKRGQFLTWAKAELDMGAAYGSAFFARHNPKRTMVVTKECYMLSHPSMPNFLLAENVEINQMQWVDPSSPMQPLIFATEAEAKKTSTYMSDWKNQYSNIEKITLED
jgi:hypothetical protein